MTLDANLLLAATPNGSLSLGELLAFARRNSLFKTLLLESLSEKFIQAAARSAGISVSSEELQQSANRFRQQQGLCGVEDTQTWLQSNGLRVIDWEARIERALLGEKFRDQLMKQHHEQYFAAQGERYACARVSHFAVPTEGLARELVARLNDEGADFHELSRQHAVLSAGTIENRVVMRCELPEGMADVVFQTKPERTTNPVPSQQGWHLFYVHELMPPRLDEPTKARVRQELFGIWLKERLANVRIDLSGLDQL